MKHAIPALVGEEAPTQQGLRIHHLDVVKKLNAAFPGWEADRGARHGIWHPKMDTRTGLRYKHKHVCSMDRGWMRQWPEWNTKSGVVEVPLDYALLHDDFPVVSVSDARGETIPEDATAKVLRPRLKSVEHVGWAEVFYHVLATGITQGISGLNAPWLAHTFMVPMDWIATVKGPPLGESFRTARAKGMV